MNHNCPICNKQFRPGDRVVRLGVVVGNNNRGPFVGDDGYAHLDCTKEKK